MGARLQAIAETLDPYDMIQVSSSDNSIDIITVAEQEAIAASASAPASPDGTAPTGQSGGMEVEWQDVAPGDITPSIVIGVPVFDEIEDTTVNPYRRIGLGTWLPASGSSTGICTAWMFGANVIATSAHCFQEHEDAEFYFFDRYYPAYSDGPSGYGSCTDVDYFVPSGWFRNYTTQFDFAALRLNCAVGNQTGWFGLYDWGSFDTVGRYVDVTGYPWECLPDGPMYSGSTPPDIKNDFSFYLLYKHDTCGGMSGAPVYRTNLNDTINGCTGYCVFGIHHGGPYEDYCIPGVSSSGQCNVGRKITGGVYDFLVTVRSGGDPD